MAIQSRTTAANAGSAVTVTGSEALLVAARPGRQTLWLCNDHATQVIYCKFHATTAAVLNSGLRIGPASSVPIEGYDGAVRAIATGAGTVCTILEL